MPVTNCKGRREVIRKTSATSEMSGTSVLASERHTVGYVTAVNKVSASIMSRFQSQTHARVPLSSSDVGLRNSKKEGTAPWFWLRAAGLRTALHEATSATPPLTRAIGGEGGV